MLKSKKKTKSSAARDPEPEDGFNSALPDPEFAKLTLERFEKYHGKPGAEERRALLQISSHSRFLARAAIRDHEIASFPFSNTDKTKTAIEKKLASLSRKTKNTDDFFELLRRYKYRRLSQIIYEDINGADFTKTMAALSDLAEAILETSLKRLSTETGAGGAGKFCVLGMGKLAGKQLNLSSDIDLIYIYEDNGDARPFVNLAQKLTTEMTKGTENGFLHRVDLGLRPGGIKGTVATHTEGAVEHYFYRGETWERFALMKARPVAGDKSLGRELLRKLETFIYENNTGYDLIEDMAEMKRKFSGISKQGNVKLGAGGIRTIEFFVQTLQILNGANKYLRDSNTLSGLKKLLRRQTIPPEVAHTLSENYMFLRKVEHNLQLEEETQTHSVPKSPERLSKLAVMTHLRNAEDFEKKLGKTMQETEKICGELFKQPSEDRAKTVMEPWEKEAVKITEYLTSGDVTGSEALRSLASLGFKRPEDALEIMTELESPSGTGADFRARGLVRKLLGILFKEAAAGGASDSALVNLKSLMARAEWKMSIYPLISAAPETLEIFIKIIGCDSPVSSFLIHKPYYMHSAVLKDRGEPGSKTEILRSLQKEMSQQRHYEDKMEILRHFKHTETLKLCVAEFEKKTDFEQTGKSLSLIAAIILEGALKLAERLAGKNGVSAAKTCLLGMGKLGGGELGYSSDLDIIIIHDGGPTEPYIKLAQKLMALLSVPDRHGRLYEIDTALRPSGNSGTLVTSFESFKKYNSPGGGGRLWERQALIKASRCAGGKMFGKKVMREIEKIVYETPLEKNFHLEISDLRKRIEKELAGENNETFNCKKGKGAMMDVEFLVQALQIKHGFAHREIRTPNTVEAIDRLAKSGIIGKRRSKTLRDGYIFLGRLAGLQGIFKKNDTELLRSEDFASLAGEFESFPTARKLRGKYISTTRAIRKIYEGFFN